MSVNQKFVSPAIRSEVSEGLKLKATKWIARMADLLKERKNKKTNPKIKNAFPVRCVETGEVFPSACHAQRHYGLAISAVSKAIYRNGQTGGYHWEYADKGNADD